MFRLALSLIALSALALPQASFAGFSGSISFSEEEKAEHEKGVDTILKEAAACLQADLAHHHAFFEAHGFSPYYGDRSVFGKLSYSAKRAYLAQRGLDTKLLDQMEPTSCVGLSLKCLEKGFTAAGQATLWKRLKDYTMLNDVDGTALQAGLQKLGWKILYWNPATNLNREWDRAEKNKNPSNSDHFWGYHEENWLSVSKHAQYLYNKVDDARLLVNFGKNVPELVKSVPFWVGTAHMGYHVFPGSYGEIVEAHSVRLITDPKTLQSAPFNPLMGEAPTDGTYFSGLIAVPAKFVETVTN